MRPSRRTCPAGRSSSPSRRASAFRPPPVPRNDLRSNLPQLVNYHGRRAGRDNGHVSRPRSNVPVDRCKALRHRTEGAILVDQVLERLPVLPLEEAPGLAPRLLVGRRDPEVEEEAGPEALDRAAPPLPMLPGFLHAL